MYCQRPLLEIHGDTTALGTFSVVATDDGKAVLTGAADAIRLNGIDEWVGGVHLDSHAAGDWRYDEQQDRLMSV